ncbi:MAG: hypothetical protein WC162_04940 [Sphaerochaetaceae bacterium]|nr:hypothetical protein [Sphaerochaetaceae bacterium]
MKKISMVLLIVLLVTGFAFAGRGPVDVTLGVLAQYNGELGDLEAGEFDGFKDVNNYQFGPEVRVKFTLLELDAAGLVSKDDDDGYIFNGFFTGGVSLDLLIARVAFGIGPDMYYETATKDFKFGPMDSIQKDKIASRNEIIGGGSALTEDDYDALDMLLTSPINLRATVDFLVGKLTVGVSATLPTNFSLDMADQWEDAIPDSEDLKRAKIGISMGIAIL